MRPKIWLGCASSTRFKVTALAEGWAKLTLALAPRLNVCQSMAPRAVLCWMFIAAPFCVTTTWPPTTFAPAGNSVGAGGAAKAAMLAPRPSAAHAGASKVRPLRLPLPLAFSATATQAPRISLQIKR